MSSNIYSMIDALRTGDASGAQDSFNRAMSEKINAALDDRKMAVASQIYNAAVEESVDLSEEETLDEAAVDAKGHKSSTGGLTQKGRDHYNRKTGGNLQAPVTKKPSELKKGSKAYNRRKSFCARMSGVKGPMKKPNGEPTRKALALKKWNC